MTMVIELSNELESRHREMATRQGIDATTFVRTVLEEQFGTTSGLTGEKRRSLYETASTEELNRALDELASRNQGLPILSAEAMESESMYDEDFE